MVSAQRRLVNQRAAPSEQGAELLDRQPGVLEPLGLSGPQHVGRCAPSPLAARRPARAGSAPEAPRRRALDAREKRQGCARQKWSTGARRRGPGQPGRLTFDRALASTCTPSKGPSETRPIRRRRLSLRFRQCVGPRIELSSREAPGRMRSCALVLFWRASSNGDARWEIAVNVTGDGARSERVLCCCHEARKRRTGGRPVVG